MIYRSIKASLLSRKSPLYVQQPSCPRKLMSAVSAAAPTALTTLRNAYGDLSVVSPLPADVASARAGLEGVLAAADRGVWLRLPWSQAALLPMVAGLQWGTRN